jgi:hypothetical protein
VRAAKIGLNDHVDLPGEVVFRHACKLGLEGIVSKRLGSRYRSGRSPDWLKMKNPAAPAERLSGWVQDMVEDCPLLVSLVSLRPTLQGFADLTRDTGRRSWSWNFSSNVRPANKILAGTPQHHLATRHVRRN